MAASAIEDVLVPHERAKAVTERDAVAAERVELDGKRALHEAQLALLARAAHKEDLRLHTKEKGFSMNEFAMTEEERETYKRPWSALLIRIARQLARALEQMREHARQLLKKIEDREAAVAAGEQAAQRQLEQRETQLREHKAAVADLDQRSMVLRAKEERAAVLVAQAEAKMAVATEKQAGADAAASRNLRWVLVINTIDADPDCVEFTDSDGLRLALGVPPQAAPAIAAVLGEDPPVWARSMICQQLDLAESIKAADKREREAVYAAERLADMVEQAGPVLTPAQQEIATEATRAAERWTPARQPGRGSMEM